MQEPKKIPLTDNPRNKEPEKIPLKCYPQNIEDDVWIPNYTSGGGIIYTRKNENNLENNS